MKKLLVNKEGKVQYIVDYPERPDQPSLAYYQLIDKAKDSAVDCASQIDAENIIWTDYVSHRPNDAWVGLISDTIHPFPEDRYDVEVKEEPIPCPDGIDGCGVYHFKRVAVITPKKEEQKRLLIEMMQEDEKNGMYDVPMCKACRIEVNDEQVKQMPEHTCEKGPRRELPQVKTPKQDELKDIDVTQLKEDGPLKALQDYLDNTPEEELKKVWGAVEAMDLGGPTVEEYFDGLSGSPKRIAELESENAQLRSDLYHAQGNLEISERTVEELKATLDEYRRYVRW